MLAVGLQWPETVGRGWERAVCPRCYPLARLCLVPGLHPGQLRAAAHPKTSLDPKTEPGFEKFLLFLLCLCVFFKL